MPRRFKQKLSAVVQATTIADLVRRVAALRPAHVAYVACDPVALARDLGTFRELGYAAGDVRAFDLFPHSHHVEAVVLLTRDRADR